jgi:membrane-bound lytic murein transglycosylase F
MQKREDKRLKENHLVIAKRSSIKSLKLWTLIFIFIVSCSDPDQVRKWNDIKKEGVLRVLTTNSTTTYFKDRDNQIEGFEYELSKDFAKHHNLEVKFIIKETINDVIESLKRGEGDIAAAGLTITKQRKEKLLFSPPYFKVHQVVTCKKPMVIKSLETLKKLKIIIPKGTSYSENLQLVRKKQPLLLWEESPNSTSEAILQKIWKNDQYCTIIDSHILNLHRRYMPELHKVYTFKSADKIAWAIHIKNTRLLSKITSWFKHKKTKKLTTQLKRKYYDFMKFDPYNLKTFLQRIETRLPKYKETFIKAAIKYELPWELLAAVGYQESYWDPLAQSPTGVRGLMMLTRRTAKEMKVKNRLDPIQSIEGGAKYLRKLMSYIPDYIHPEDKIWYVLASYNVGYYHLRDAMSLTILQNKNPSRWHDVKQVLPLISHKKYYIHLPYGHARGLEPVIYVDRIKDFYDIIKKKEAQTAPIKIYN